LELGSALARDLPPKTVICLYGPLGAGKTTLIKGLASAVAQCGVHEVTSPTFLTMHLYEGQRTVCHFDLYRLETPGCVELDEMIHFADLCCIEWPERAEGLLPARRLNIYIEPLSEDQRHISWEWYGAA
jgi:tRNA threonylcarbamoyladenosine biosynthesis protein TsaE